MALSILVAKIIALVYLAAGFAAVTGKIDFKKMVDSFERSPGLTYMSGLMAVIIGMLMVTYHNIWVKDWPVLVTIIGWAALIKGIMFIACPAMMSYFKPWYKNTKPWGVLMLVVGLIFGYFGFIA